MRQRNPRRVLFQSGFRNQREVELVSYTVVSRKVVNVNATMSKVILDNDGIALD